MAFERFTRRKVQGNRWSYSAWDGTQKGFELDADQILEQLTDDLLYHGDLNAALRRMLQQGFEDRNGERVQGMRELLERLRQERRERLEQSDLGGVYDDIAQRLRDVVDTERAGIDAFEQAARDSGDQRRQEVAEAAALDKRMALDFLPPDLSGQVRSLSDYEFTSPEAHRQFQELMDELRSEVANSYFNQMSGAMAETSPEDLARMKDMLAELNQMLDQRQRGEEPDFDGFMERYGDFFPENPQNLDELLEIMARRMAAMQAMLNSMSPEQREQLRGLAEQLLEDMDLRWQAEQLASNLQSMFPDAGWDQRFNFQGDDPLSWGQGAEMLRDLGDMDQLEQMLQGSSNPGALAEVDLERARQLLGDESAESLERLGEIQQRLLDAGLVEQKGGRLELTPRGIRQIGNNALAELFANLRKDSLGRHEVERTGVGHERAFESKPYEFGDPFNLDIHRTIRNALGRAGSGTPVRLLPEDFEVERTELVTRASTVLMLDVSMSMPMRDNFLAAKKVAMALHALIAGQYPRDYMGVVTFSKIAREIKPEQLPEVSWDFDFGTNMQHGLLLARRMLNKQTGTKQIIMITDGEPTAHLEVGMSEPFFSYPPVRETVDATLREVNRCTRDGIRINTFMLDASGYLRDFVQKITQLNRGRAFFTTPDTLGDYVLVDFLEQRREQRLGRRGA